jgi:ParB/RepB/Spo0J family partition protein
MVRIKPAGSVARAQSATSDRIGSHPFVEGLQATAILDISMKDIDHENSDLQYRTTTAIDDLTASIVREGQHEPIDVTDSKPHRIIDGFRRVQAIADLGWPTVKAIVHRGLTDEQAHQLAFTKNVVRKNLQPLDKANAIRLAKRRGLTHTVIANEFRMSERQLHRYEQMLEFSRPLQVLIDSNDVSMAHASILAKFDGIDLADWVEKIHRNNWSAVDVSRQLRVTLGKRLEPGRRPIVKVGKDDCRVYGRRFSRKTDPEEIRRTIAALKQVIEFLEDVADSPSTPKTENLVNRTVQNLTQRDQK